jgi:cellulose synthase/poly-beta-1,6-N-acetylglucosamine synthase-like glycosyltransferase
MPRQIVIVIPAKNEAERIRGALRAVDRAAARMPLSVAAFVLANNCADDTLGVTQEIAGQLRNCTVKAMGVALPARFAHAGGARRTAVQCGMAQFDATPDDIILSTDADARLRPDSMGRIGRAFSGGDHLVLAKIECIRDPLDPVPHEALSWGRPGVLWRHCVRRLVETVRQGSVAPPHYHDDYGGAGIAVRVATYNELGGFAAVASNEDLALVQAADRANKRVNRHSGAIVDVLARANGRAEGGMAAALASCVVAAARRLPCLVEHHAVTVGRVLRNPSHANAFADVVTEWEPVESAIAGIEDEIASFARFA